jgi:hypothetical protein
MRKIPNKRIKAIQDKAKELMELVNKEGCRLICRLGSDDWSVGIKVVPTEVEMGEYGHDDAEPIDNDELQTTGLFATVLNTEIYSLFEEGKCEDPYKF